MGIGLHASHFEWGPALLGVNARGTTNLIELLVQAQRLGALRQDLERLQELDDGTPIISRQPCERCAGRESFTGVSHYRFSHGSEFPMVAEGVLVRNSPQLASDELPVTGEEAHGSLGIIRPGTGKAAWNMVTAVTSARVNSFVKPSPSGSVSMPKRSVD
jgi:hypothetical protein